MKNIHKLLFLLSFLVGIVKSYKENTDVYDEAYEQAENYFQLGKDQVQFNYISTLDSPIFFEEYEEAIKYFDKSIQANPFKNRIKLNAYLHKGYYLFASWNFSQGIEALNKGIELYPDTGSFDLYYYKVYGLYKLKKFDEALETSDKLIELYPRNLYSYFQKGVLLYNLGLFNESLKYLNEAYKLNNTDELTNLYRETVLFKLKRYEDALDLIEKLPKYEISSTNDEYQLYIFNYKLNEFKYNMTCRNISMFDCLPISLLLISNKKYNNAIKYLNITIEFSSDNIEKSVSLFLKSKCEIQLGEFDNAEISLNNAIELNPNMARLYTEKGYLMEKQSKFDQAIELYNKAIEIDSNNAEATYKKGKLLLLLKKYHYEL